MMYTVKFYHYVPNKNTEKVHEASTSSLQAALSLYGTLVNSSTYTRVEILDRNSPTETVCLNSWTSPW